MPLINSLVLLVLFINKMKMLLRDLNVLSKSAHLQKKQFEFVAMMAQLSCLIIICMISTFISIAGIIRSATSDHSFYFAIISCLISSFDVAINALCMVLHWSFARPYYKAWCNSCHKFLITIYSQSGRNQNKNATDQTKSNGKHKMNVDIAIATRSCSDA